MQTKRNAGMHRFFKGTIMVVAGIAFAAVFVHFSWNMAVPELFGAVEMSYKNAFGLVVLAGTISMVAGLYRVGHRIRFGTSSKPEDGSR